MALVQGAARLWRESRDCHHLCLVGSQKHLQRSMRANIAKFLWMRTFVAASRRDGRIYYLSPESATIVYRAEPIHAAGGAWCMVYLPHCECIATGWCDGFLRIIALKTLEMTATAYEGNGYVRAMEQFIAHENGREEQHVIAGWDSGQLCIYRLTATKSLEQIWQINVGSRICCITRIKRSETLVAGTHEGELLYVVGSSGEIQGRVVHGNAAACPVECIAVSRNGEDIACGSYNILRFFLADLVTVCDRRLLFTRDCEVWCIAFAEDDQLLILGCKAPDPIRILSRSAGWAIVREVRLGTVNNLHYNDEKRVVYAACNDGCVYRVKTNELYHVLPFVSTCIDGDWNLHAPFVTGCCVWPLCFGAHAHRELREVWALTEFELCPL